MSIVEKALGSIRLPSLCLLKNADFDVASHPNVVFTHCQGVIHGDDLDDLWQRIPRPVPPRDLRRRKLYEKHVPHFEHRWDDDDAPRFDDFLHHFLQGPSDLEIYRESHTILLVTPPDVRIAVAYLLRVMPLEEGGLTGLSLSRLWTDYVDRISFWPHAADPQETWSEITEALHDDGAIVQEAWDDLDDWLMK